MTQQPLRSSLRRWVLAVASAVAAVGSGCGIFEIRDPRNDTAESVYKTAKADQENGAWDAAIKGFSRVEALGAGTLLAQQAQLDLAYTQWRQGERESALATLDRFIKFNPSSPALDYALYLRGLTNFNDNLGLFGSLAGQDLAERDQKATRDAWLSFKQLVDQFPDSKYTADAQVRMDFIINALANHELHVARYYFRRGAFVAAANRAQRAVAEFPTSPAAEEALHIMAQSYDKLELPQLRDDARRVLQKNFPNSRYAGDTLRRADKAWWRFW